MKKAILTFEKCQILLAELPDVKEIRIEKDIIKNLLVLEEVFRVYDGEKYLFRVPHPAELIGKLSELTEEVFAEIVHWNEVSQYYTDYTKAGWQGDITATESFLSKLRAEGFHTENPKGPFEDAVTAPPGCVARVPEEEAWEDAEERTFSPDRTYLFKIVKQ